VAGTLGVLQRELRAVHGTVSVHASLGGVPVEEDREAQEQAKKLRKESRCMISPEGNFRATWDMLQVFLLVYLAYMVPLRVGYDLHVVTFGRLWWVDALVDAYFIVDVGLNFRTGYLLEQDHETPVIIMAWRKVGVRYMKGWLLIDVVASFPLEFIRLMTGRDWLGDDASSVKAVKTLRLIRLTKLLRLARMQRIWERYELLFSWMDVGSLARIAREVGLCLSALYCAHLASCVWAFIGMLDDGWLSDVEVSVVGSAWQQNQTLPLITHYARIYQWAIGMLVGSDRGLIRPTNDGEIVFEIIMMLTGTLVLSIIIGTVGSILMSSKLLEAKVARQRAELQEFLTQRHIPRDMARKVRRYMNNLYAKNSGYNEQKMMSMLPPLLSKELLDHIYGATVINVPLFRGMPEQVVRNVCFKLKPYTALKGDVLFREGEVGREMYIIEMGEIEISRYNIVLTLLSKGSFLGEDVLDAEDETVRRERTAIATINSELAFLSCDDVKELSHEFPLLKRQLEDFSTRRNRRQNAKLQQVLEETALSLGEEADSPVMMEIREAMSLLMTPFEHIHDTAVLAAAAVRVQKHWRSKKARRHIGNLKKLKNAHHATRQSFMVKGAIGVAESLLAQLTVGSGAGRQLLRSSSCADTRAAPRSRARSSTHGGQMTADRTTKILLDIQGTVLAMAENGKPAAEPSQTPHRAAHANSDGSSTTGLLLEMRDMLRDLQARVRRLEQPAAATGGPPPRPRSSESSTDLPIVAEQLEERAGGVDGGNAIDA